MRIATVDIKKLKPAPYNPRTISSEVLNLLKKNIKEFGVVDPLIINKKNNHVVGGNQRLQALKDLKFKKVPVVWVDLNLKKEKALNLALNKISGDWDYDKLKSIFSDIGSKNFDLDLTGFSLDEIKFYITDTLPKEKNMPASKDISFNSKCPKCGYNY